MPDMTSPAVLDSDSTPPTVLHMHLCTIHAALDAWTCGTTHWFMPRLKFSVYCGLVHMLAVSLFSWSNPGMWSMHARHGVCMIQHMLHAFVVAKECRLQ